MIHAEYNIDLMITAKYYITHSQALRLFLCTQEIGTDQIMHMNKIRPSKVSLVKTTMVTMTMPLGTELSSFSPTVIFSLCVAVM